MTAHLTKSDRLLSRLMRREVPTAPADFGEVSEMLAALDSGRVSPERQSEVEELLRNYRARGIVTFTETTRLCAAVSPFASLWGGSSHVETFEQEMRRKRKAEAARTPTTVTVHQISPAELALNARDLLKAAGYWPKWADQWCGATCYQATPTNDVQRESAHGAEAWKERNDAIDNLHSSGKLDRFIEAGVCSDDWNPFPNASTSKWLQKSGCLRVKDTLTHYEKFETAAIQQLERKLRAAEKRADKKRPKFVHTSTLKAN